MLIMDVSFTGPSGKLPWAEKRGRSSEGLARRRGVDSLLFVWAWGVSAGAGDSVWRCNHGSEPFIRSSIHPYGNFVHTSLFQEPNAEYMDKQLSAMIAPLRWRMRGERSVDVAGELQEGGRFHRDKTRDGEAVLSPQADHFTGVKWKEKASAYFDRNDGGVRALCRATWVRRVLD